MTNHRILFALAKEAIRRGLEKRGSTALTRHMEALIGAGQEGHARSLMQRVAGGLPDLKPRTLGQVVKPAQGTAGIAMSAKPGQHMGGEGEHRWWRSVGGENFQGPSGMGARKVTLNRATEKYEQRAFKQQQEAVQRANEPGSGVEGMITPMTDGKIIPWLKKQEGYKPNSLLSGHRTTNWHESVPADPDNIHPSVDQVNEWITKMKRNNTMRHFSFSDTKPENFHMTAGGPELLDPQIYLHDHGERMYASPTARRMVRARDMLDPETKEEAKRMMYSKLYP